MSLHALRIPAVLLAAAVSTALALWGPSPADGRQVAFGMYTEGAPWDRGAMNRFVAEVGLRPVIWHTYRNWDEDPFPYDSLHNSDDMGGVALVTWEPWGRDLRSIASGRYDGYVRDSAREARAWGKPVLLRFAHEMNGGWYPWGADDNSGADYRRAWRHIYRVFRRQGATNVKWVWAPNTGQFRRFFPGDRYVQFTGLDGYNWGAKYGSWDSFEDVFDSSYREITHLSRRPLLITEFGANARGGDKAAWIRHAFSRKVARRYPRIRALVYFNKESDGGDWRVDSSDAVLRAFRQSVNKPLLQLNVHGLFRGSSAGAFEPAPPADPQPSSQPPPDGETNDASCAALPGTAIQVRSDWTIDVGVRCNGRVTSCYGAVRVRAAGRQLGRARLDLYANRSQGVTIGLPGWARSSLRKRSHVTATIWLDVMQGPCGGGSAHRVELSR
jgi:hypothetical protein